MLDFFFLFFLSFPGWLAESSVTSGVSRVTPTQHCHPQPGGLAATRFSPCPKALQESGRGWRTNWSSPACPGLSQPSLRVCPSSWLSPWPLGSVPCSVLCRLERLENAAQQHRALIHPQPGFPRALPGETPCHKLPFPWRIPGWGCRGGFVCWAPGPAALLVPNCDPGHKL